MNALALLFVLAFVVSVDLRIIAPVLPSIATSLHATARLASAIEHAVAYGQGSSRSVDRFGRAGGGWPRSGGRIAPRSPPLRHHVAVRGGSPAGGSCPSSSSR
jgi:hypothetical protein